MKRIEIHLIRSVPFFRLTIVEGPCWKRSICTSKLMAFVLQELSDDFRIQVTLRLNVEIAVSIIKIVKTFNECQRDVHQFQFQLSPVRHASVASTQAACLTSPSKENFKILPTTTGINRWSTKPVDLQAIPSARHLLIR